MDAFVKRSCNHSGIKRIQINKTPQTGGRLMSATGFVIVKIAGNQSEVTLTPAAIPNVREIAIVPRGAVHA